MPTITLDLVGAQLHFADAGTPGNDTVVLLHGFPLAGRMWEKHLRSLQDAYRVVAPDLRGFGDSPPPFDPHSARMEDHADDVAAMLALLGIERAVVVGEGFGGRVAMAVAERHRELVAALVLAGTSTEGASFSEQVELEEQQQLVEREGNGQLVLEQLIGRLVSERSHLRDEAIREVRRCAAAMPAAGWIAALEALKERGDVTRELGTVDAPVLVMVGEDDQIVPPGTAGAMHRQIPGAELVVVPEAGNLPSLENPAVFARSLREFADRL